MSHIGKLENRKKVREWQKQNSLKISLGFGLRTFANFCRVLVLVQRIWSRKKSLGYGFGEFGLGKKVSVLVSENLVGFGEFGLGKKSWF